jgi:hypothetical protein
MSCGAITQPASRGPSIVVLRHAAQPLSRFDSAVNIGKEQAHAAEVLQKHFGRNRNVGRLVDAPADPDMQVRLASVMTLERLGTRAVSAVPALGRAAGAVSSSPCGGRRAGR